MDIEKVRRNLDTPADAIGDIEIKLFLEGVFLKYGYDFRGYSPASLKRRILSTLMTSKHETLLSMLDEILHDAGYFRSVISKLTVGVTEMFRDPFFYRALRTEVIPLLKTYPSVRIWHAGCSTGEEVYSMAILLQEEGLLSKSLIYATDINTQALQVAKSGIYSAAQIQKFTLNYQAAGGIEPFSSYYTSLYDATKMNSDLQSHISFNQHNLVTDEVFAEVHLVICRNVLIYFNRELQNRVFSLFDHALVRRGFLCLGNKETLELSNHKPKFEPVNKAQRIYKKN